jgi:hypothetical protein
MTYEKGQGHFLQCGLPETISQTNVDLSEFCLGKPSLNLMVDHHVE